MARRKAAPRQQVAVAEKSDPLLTMDQAIARLRTTRPTFHRWLKAGRIKGMKVGRQWRFREEDLERFLSGEAPRVAPAVDFSPLIDVLLEQLGDARGGDVRAHDRTVDEAANLLLRLAHVQRATDLHIAGHLPVGEQQPKMIVRLRISGVLHEVARTDARLLPAIIERFKSMAACDPRETRRPQTGRTRIELEGQPLECRVTFRPTHHGEAMAARLLYQLQGVTAFDLQKLGMAQPHLDTLRRALRASGGLIVINGPAGSGKTSTLYAAILELDREQKKVVTIEDPVEYALPWVEQTQLDPSSGLDYAAAMRAILRSDPDVIMVGEIRSAEAARLAAQAALIGHLVLTTTHAEDAVESVLRLVDLAGDPVLVADSLRLVVAQRLVRRLDPEQSEPYELDPDTRDRVTDRLRETGVSLGDLPRAWRRPRSGSDMIAAYRGRLSVNETLVVEGELSRAIRRGEEVDALRRRAMASGMRPIAAEAIRLAAEGHTSVDEALRVGGR